VGGSYTKMTKNKSLYPMPIREWSEDDRPREKLLKYGEHTLNTSVLSALFAPWNFRQRAEAPSVINQRGIFHWGAIIYELTMAIMIRTGAPGKPATITAGKHCWNWKGISQ